MKEALARNPIARWAILLAAIATACDSRERGDPKAAAAYGKPVSCPRPNIDRSQWPIQRVSFAAMTIRLPQSADTVKLPDIFGTYLMLRAKDITVTIGTAALGNSPLEIGSDLPPGIAPCVDTVDGRRTDVQRGVTETSYQPGSALSAVFKGRDSVTTLGLFSPSRTAGDTLLAILSTIRFLPPPHQ